MTDERQALFMAMSTPCVDGAILLLWEQPGGVAFSHESRGEIRSHGCTTINGDLALFIGHLAGYAAGIADHREGDVQLGLPGAAVSSQTL